MKLNKFFLGLFIGLFFVDVTFSTEQEKDDRLKEAMELIAFYRCYYGQLNDTRAAFLMNSFKSKQWHAGVLDVFLEEEDAVTKSITTLGAIIALADVDEDEGLLAKERKLFFIRTILEKFHPNLNRFCGFNKDCNQKDSPLMMAVTARNINLVQLLCKYGASCEVPCQKNGNRFSPIELAFYWLETNVVWERGGIASWYAKRIGDRKDSLKDFTPELSSFDEKYELENLSKIHCQSLAKQDLVLENTIVGTSKILDALLSIGASLAPISKQIKTLRQGKTKAAMVGVLRKHKQGRPFVCSSEVCNFDATHHFREKFQKLKACSACENIWYCNADCQKADWKKHKTLCAALKDEKIIDEVVNLYKTFKLQETIFTVD